MIQQALRAIQQGDAELTHRLCRGALSVSPDDVNGWFLMALAARGRSDHATAARLFGRSLRLHPDFAAAWYNLGRTCRDLGRLEQAADAFFRAFALQPANADAAVQAGRCHVVLSRPDPALACFQAAVRSAPDWAEAHLQAGLVLQWLNRAPEALACVGRALRLQPDFAEAWFNRGALLIELDRPAEAERALGRCCRLAPGEARYFTRRAISLKHLGRFRQALEVLAAAPNPDPDDFLTVCTRAELLEALGRIDEAYQAYGAAQRINGAFGLPGTRRAVIDLGRRYGQPAAAPPAPPGAAGGDGLVTMSTLGANGRFGNQLLQYAFLRMYAAAYRLDYQAPAWLGTWLYDLADPPVTETLPRVHEARDRLEESLVGASGIVFRRHDLEGYFCKSTRYLAGHAGLFRRLFTPGRLTRALADDAIAALRARGRTVVALHLRRGDYGWGPFWIAPVDWYLAWLAPLWPALDRPVLYIASDDPGLKAAFAAYGPVGAEDISARSAWLPHLDFFVDHWVLSRADLVAISNSTFSFTATMLNAAGSACWRPERQTGRLVRYDPWDAPVLLES